MTVWLLTVVLSFPPEGSGLPFVSKAKCVQAAAEAAFTVSGVRYYCTEVQRTEEHDLFFIKVARAKEKVARARAKRRKEQAVNAAWGIQ